MIAKINEKIWFNLRSCVTFAVHTVDQLLWSTPAPELGRVSTLDFIDRVEARSRQGFYPRSSHGASARSRQGTCPRFETLGTGARSRQGVRPRISTGSF